jgi:hypothetical protein
MAAAVNKTPPISHKSPSTSSRHSSRVTNAAILVIQAAEFVMKRSPGVTHTAVFVIETAVCVTKQPFRSFPESTTYSLSNLSTEGKSSKINYLRNRRPQTETCPRQGHVALRIPSTTPSPSLCARRATTIGTEQLDFRSRVRKVEPGGRRVAAVLILNLSEPTPWAMCRAHNSAVECHLHTVEVVGSNPAAPTRIGLRKPGVLWISDRTKYAGGRRSRFSPESAGIQPPLRALK